MPRIGVDRFSGSRPRLASHLLSETQAALALDCRFDHGTLDAWREPRRFRAVPAGTRTSVQFGCCWLDFQACVDTAVGPVGCNRLYATGVPGLPYPVVIEVNPGSCSASTRRLGLPCPASPPSVITGGGAGLADKDHEGRSYAYQYENAQGERSALSAASDALTVRDGTASVVSGWAVPDASWAVTQVLIYRSVSAVGASMSAPSAANEPDTTWMLVGSAGIGAASFTDTRYNDELQDALEQDVVQPPPAALRGITAVSSMNCLAGFVGNRLYFSENGSYHNWQHYLELDDNICAIVESNKVIYVATDGTPYAVTAEADCKTAQCRAAVRLPTAWPMTGCGNHHMAALPQGAVYPSHNGLVALSGNSAPTLLTNPLYAAEDWQRLRPHTVVPEVHGGMLFVFAAGGSFVISLDNGAEGGWDANTHSELSDQGVLNAHTTRSGDMFLLKSDGFLYHWDRGLAKRPYRWLSKRWTLPKPVAMAAGRVCFTQGAAQVTVSEGRHTVFSEQLIEADPFSLPSWSFGTDWQVEIKGVATISQLSLATSFEEL